jgi:thioredoxin reductase (NADPH)
VAKQSGVDCLIIGGGPAGLTAAIYLARFRREILLVDDAQSRAELIPSSHNYPGYRGISGRDLLHALRSQAAQYDIAHENQTVTDLNRKPDGTFAAGLKSGRTVFARRVLLATGIVDQSPDVPGLPKVVDHGTIRFCPICDAYEAMDRRIGVLGPAEHAAQKALFLRTYSRTISILPTDDERMIRATIRRELRAAGIAIASARVTDVEMEGERITAVMADGRRCTVDVLYPALGSTIRSELALKLGVRSTRAGGLFANARQQTSVRHLFAAGDVVSDLHQLAVATGHAAVAATSIHNSLQRNDR